MTQVCPGPVDSEFDQVAGSAEGMSGTPARLFRISAAQCAREAVTGFERGAALVFPGRAYRFLMRMLPVFPLPMRRRQAASIAGRLRAGRGVTPKWHCAWLHLLPGRLVSKERQRPQHVASRYRFPGHVFGNCKANDVARSGYILQKPNDLIWCHPSTRNTG